MTEHPSRFMLERHCVGDLPPSERERAVYHLEVCAGCRGRVAEFREHAERELTALPPEQFMAKLSARRARERSSTRFLRVGAFAAAAAAAALLFLAPRRQGSIALRGTGFQVHRNRGGVAKLMEPGDRIRAGDALGIVVTLPRHQPVDVWFLDASGRVDRLLSGGALQLSAGEQVLPGSAVVDSPCSDMWVVVGVGAASASSVEATLKHLGTGSREHGDDWVPKGCLARRLQCE